MALPSWTSQKIIAASLFREVQSLHWVCVQATLLIIVIIRHARPGVDGTAFSRREVDTSLFDDDIGIDVERFVQDHVMD